MKFRLKITLCMLCLLSLLFGIGGGALISLSFQTSLEQEKAAARGTYQLLLNTLMVVNRIETWNVADDISVVLSQLSDDNAFSWSALQISTEAETIYGNGAVAELLATNKKTTQPEYCLLSGISGLDKQRYLQLSGAFTVGEETLYLGALRDITPIYEMQAQQTESYRKIYLFLVLACAALTYSISWFLTRPLVKLSRASKEIAGGNLSSRSAVKSNDEVGALSADFDFMAANMEEKMRELKDAMARGERFMRNFTHELKTPMASLIGNADLLRMRALTPDEQAEAAHYIFTAGKRLENLSIRLLDIFAAGNQTLRLRETSPGALVGKVVKSMEFPGKHIEVSTECEDGTCRMEPDLIWSLLVNLIDNARKAIGQEGRIDITSEMTEDGCILCVTDNGRGIPPEAMEHITEAFYRADEARSGAQSGAGLGLALCAKIVELHGGTMAFDSEVGKGTRVKVELKGGRR